MRVSFRYIGVPLWAFFSLTAATQDAEMAPFSATVSDIATANVIQVSEGEDRRSLVLYGAVCAQAGSDEGKQALALTKRLVRVGAQVDVLPRLIDGNILYADVLLSDGRNLAHELVRNGWARWDKNRAGDDAYLGSLETLARNAKNGRWKDSDAPAASLPVPVVQERPMPSAAPRPTVSQDAPAYEEPQPRRVAAAAPDSLQKGERDVYTDEYGVVHFRSKGDTDPEVIAEARRQTYERHAQRQEIQRQYEAEMRRQYAEYLAEVRAQQAADRQAAMEYQDWLLDQEQKALRNESLRIRNNNNSYWNYFPYRHYGNYPVVYRVPNVYYSGSHHSTTHTGPANQEHPPMNHGALILEQEQE